jgi:hypothetical protein
LRIPSFSSPSYLQIGELARRRDEEWKNRRPRTERRLMANSMPMVSIFLQKRARFLPRAVDPQKKPAHPSMRRPS